MATKAPRRRRQASSLAAVHRQSDGVGMVSDARSLFTCRKAYRHGPSGATSRGIGARRLGRGAGDCATLIATCCWATARDHRSGRVAVVAARMRARLSSGSDWKGIRSRAFLSRRRIPTYPGQLRKGADFGPPETLMKTSALILTAAPGERLAE